MTPSRRPLGPVIPLPPEQPPPGATEAELRLEIEALRAALRYQRGLTDDLAATVQRLEDER